MSTTPTRRSSVRRRGRVRAALLVLVTLLWTPLTACSEMASDDPALAVKMPDLDVGERPVPQEQRYDDPLFTQVSLHGHTYTLPCPLRDFLDHGWRITSKEKTVNTDGGGTDRLDEFDTVEPDNSAVVNLSDDEDNWMQVRTYNHEPDPVVVEDSQVWGATIFAGTVEPHPGIHGGVSREDVEGILGKPDAFVDSRLVYLSNPLTVEQAADLSGQYDSGCALNPNSCEPRRMGGSSLELSVVSDGTLYGTYDISVGSARQPGRDKKKLSVPGPYHCDPADPSTKNNHDRSFDYSYVVPAELRDFVAPSSIPAYASEYMIDGQRFAVWAQEKPACDVMSYETVSEQVAYLKHPNQGSDGGRSHRLLWNDKESSAAVTIFEGQGSLTGDEVMRVTLNYCDWERRERVSLRFSIIGLDSGTKISEDASTYLLGVVSDVADSIERT